ncbi:hypothetical protein [Chryseobacterium tongliaoense]|uniref:hypothetical protein n=1 Tax=Chryseobacterium tongliaoense TaxID=3240933 RepID=UPI0035163E53
MIRRLQYNEIDFKKYTECLEKSEQRKYSASRSFLDVTSNKHWELLVYNDYEAVMPVPYVKKYGFKIVHSPMLCQQLGIFSEKDDPGINEIFLEFLQKNYLIRVYKFNDANQFQSSLPQRKNFLIFLGSYEKVSARYSPKRKRKLRLNQDVIKNSEIKSISFSEAKGFIEANILGADKDDDIEGFIHIFEKFYELKSLEFLAFYYQNTLINLIVTYNDSRTVALLGTFNDKEYVKISGASALIDRSIKENIETKIFDFEGGELPNIEEFFRGFRPELKPYAVLENSMKILIQNFVRFIIKGKIQSLR